MDRPKPRLGREFFARPTAGVAVELVGCTLWRYTAAGITAGRIVETEAYLDASDRASHAAWSKRGQDVMRRAPGTVYIYRCYGMHWMFNIVAHAPDTVGAVLIRAVEPVEGIDIMEGRRGLTEIRQLCSGPGKLCQAFDIDESLHKIDLVTSDTVWLTAGNRSEAPTLIAGKRIGITKSPELPLRFFAAGNRYVSAHRRGVPFTSEVIPSF
ncbi:MAG: DNA-3-methyladenine glycosylase [Thermomicrobiales bacterium]|nr:DNA-3-methyladenine glycosylase [Thermomicrobiales bacterium]